MTVDVIATQADRGLEEADATSRTDETPHTSGSKLREHKLPRALPQENEGWMFSMKDHQREVGM